MRIKPVNFSLRVCQLPYTHVLHYENLSREWTEFISVLGIPQHIDLPWENRGGADDLKSYFRTVSEEDTLQLFNKFYTDFKMFGYEIHDVF